MAYVHRWKDKAMTLSLSAIVIDSCQDFRRSARRHINSTTATSALPAWDRERRLVLSFPFFARVRGSAFGFSHLPTWPRLSVLIVVGVAFNLCPSLQLGRVSSICFTSLVLRSRFRRSGGERRVPVGGNCHKKDCFVVLFFFFLCSVTWKHAAIVLIVAKE